jgi:glutamate synthase domain-containing protein 2
MVIGEPSQVDDLLKAVKQRDIKDAPDFITLDGAEGGTGAAPMALIDSVGMSIRESLPILVDKLKQYGLRERIKVIASGKIVTPSKLAWALCVGADFCVSARGFMFSLGCIQALQCNKNTCPTGITTHNPKFQRGLNPLSKAVRVANYVENMNKEVGIIAHSCGVKSPRALNRSHARIVQGNGKTIGLNELYPEPESVND